MILALPVPAQNAHGTSLAVAHSRAAFSEASEWARAAVKATVVALAAGALVAGALAAGALAAGMEAAEDIVGNGRKEEGWTGISKSATSSFNFFIQFALCLQ